MGFEEPGVRRRYTGTMLDVEAAAEVLGCTAKALRHRIARREVPFRRYQGRIVFTRTDLDAFVARLPGCSVREAIDNIEGHSRGTLRAIK